MERKAAAELQIRNIAQVVKNWNPGMKQEEVIREMLPPGGCTFINPNKGKEENITVKKPNGKRAIFRLLAKNLISQNPPRGETGDRL